MDDRIAEILDLLKRAKLHEWGDAPTVCAVRGDGPFITTTLIALEFDKPEDAQKLIGLLQK